ncbi:splicing regulator SDE2 [Drosophila tropicalis]|uniref:splicing regulator SDE2 n=1 Tax=Drosophila tropicalis TaxID=46794 RepID=UPI0035ABD26D
MVTNIFIGNKLIVSTNSGGKSYTQLCFSIEEVTHMQPAEYYLVDSKGKRLTETQDLCHDDNIQIHCVLRQLGGKGGFGSMLRAIGAQIEKTTNREACRDLSGRRLRDINEEKRVRAWLEKQGEREREAEERKKRKIEKLLAVPKHEFKDEQYDEARANLTEKVNNAFEEGLKQAKPDSETSSSKGAIKRKSGDQSAAPKTKKKPALWIGDDLSSSGTDSDDSDASDKAVVAIRT